MASSLHRENRRQVFFDATRDERRAEASEAQRTGDIRIADELADRQAFFAAARGSADRAHRAADHAAPSRDATARPPRREDRRLVFCGARTAGQRIERLGHVRVAAELVERQAFDARNAADQAEPRRVERRMELAANATRSAAEAANAATRHDERRAEIVAAAAAAEAAYPDADQAAAADEYARFAELNRQLGRLQDDRAVRAARATRLRNAARRAEAAADAAAATAMEAAREADRVREADRLASHNRALAAVAAAAARNLERRAEVAAAAQQAAALNAAAAEQAAADIAAAAAEDDAADVVLWDNAHNVDIVDGELVAMWDHLPGLQDDAASAAADLVAAQNAEAVMVRIELFLLSHNYAPPLRTCNSLHAATSSVETAFLSSFPLRARCVDSPCRPMLPALRS